MNRFDSDVLIIGSGAAALVAALSARGRRVTIITPEAEGRPAGASDLAQGGIAAAVAADDSPLLHLEDTLVAGGPEVRIAPARYVCEQALPAIEYLETLGVRFDRLGRTWSLHKEAAHSRARVLHVGDATGAAVMRSLRDSIAETGIHVMHGAVALQLLHAADRVCGVVALGADGEPLQISARDVVLATGGIGGLYACTTNPVTACGDGVAMALAAGARCTGLEFVQFHPTALDVQTDRLPLLTEALRGAGARLIDENGANVLEGVHPLAELGPRDIVARAVYLAKQRGMRIVLDATQIDHLDVGAAFPSGHRACAEHGFDLRREPVPVTPAAHYFMGGVAVDLDARTTLPGLWAVGGTAWTGIHGSNRLASNSLLEAVVFGLRCGQALTQSQVLGLSRHAQAATDIGAATHDPIVPRQLRQMMWRCMGVVRSAQTISDGMRELAQLNKRVPTDAPLQRARMLLVEQMLIAAARRTASCGAHFRSDAHTTEKLLAS